jgi:25S rRNA (adenine2142-N1)-methyltransferase
MRLGGIDAYQKASQLGQSSARGGDSSKVLVEWLHEAGHGRGSETSKRKGKGKGKAVDMEQSCGRLRRVSLCWLMRRLTPRRMLEIGAVSPSNYANCSTWIENHPIDVHSQHPHILQQDFFERPVPTLEAEHFDVISCSLVLNFLDDPQERGV